MALVPKVAIVPTCKSNSNSPFKVREKQDFSIFWMTCIDEITHVPLTEANRYELLILMLCWELNVYHQQLLLQWCDTKTE